MRWMPLLLRWERLTPPRIAKERTVSTASTSAVSCGIVILNELDEVFLAHATGGSHWDIPKGMADPGEHPLATALRECREETGLRFKPEMLLELGRIAYRPGKDLHLYAIKVPKAAIRVEHCVCRSTFTHALRKVQLPEVDQFAWVPLDHLEKRCARNMRRTLESVIEIRALATRLPLQPEGLAL